jgi:DNA-binding Lrp family transcriptional regulator
MDMKAISSVEAPPNPVMLDDRDAALIAEIQTGLPLSACPYADVGQQIGMSETEVIERLKHLLQLGVIKRLGVVVRHHELGYRANAMTVWDIPDEKVSGLGDCIGRFEFVTLCYRRPRRLPDWPYNLFTMIHGKDRDEVLSNIHLLAERCGLESIQYEVLFSKRRFKQRGAIYTANHETQGVAGRG